MIKNIIEVNRNVEIFISDKTSMDETSKVLEEYSNKYNFIRYSRNEKNLGYDLNLISVIEKLSGPTNFFNKLRSLFPLGERSWVYKIFHCYYCKGII
jgi:hypothetical protein